MATRPSLAAINGSGPAASGYAPAPAGATPAAPTDQTAAPVAGSVAPNPSLALANDPAYLAFLRAMTGQESALRSQTEGGISSLQRALQNQIPGLQQATDEDINTIGNEFGSRGFFNSGERLRQQALRQAQGAGQIAGLTGETADKISGARADLAAQLAELQRKRAEQGLESASTLYKLGAS